MSGAFWTFAIVMGAFLWWLAFVATKRMRIGKNLEREAIAKRNLERLAREQAAAADETAEKTPQNGTSEEK